MCCGREDHRNTALSRIVRIDRAAQLRRSLRLSHAQKPNRNRARGTA